MYIKVFESRQSSASYLIQYKVGKHYAESDEYWLENESHVALQVTEEELFSLLDTLFKGKQMRKSDKKAEAKLMDKKIKESEKKDLKSDAKMMKKKILKTNKDKK
jgi:hypothetical protein